MKKITAYIFMIALTTVLLTACGSKRNEPIVDTPTDTATDTPMDISDDKTINTNTDTIISEEEAMNAALKDANLLDSEISRLHIKLERDDGIQVYEVDFYSGEREYDYEIDAISGRILEKDEEPIG